MDGAEPFFFPNGPTGCLLVHGFTSHPLEMRECGEYLAQRDCTVLGVRLPGHGTTPADLASTTWMRWDEAVYQGYRALKRHAQSVTAIGSSTGGTLSLHLAVNAPLAGVVAMAPPVFELADARSRWAAWIKWLVSSVPKQKRSVKDPSVDVSPYGYDVNPVAAVAQLVRCMDHVQTCLSKVTAPVLLWQAEDDPVVTARNTERVLAAVGSKEKTLERLSRSAHMLTLDFDKNQIFERTHRFVLDHAAFPPNPS